MTSWTVTMCCCCLPCKHCSNWTWVVEEILAYGNRLRSTHCREFHYLKLCRPAYFVRTLNLNVTPEIIIYHGYVIIVAKVSSNNAAFDK